MSVIIFMFQMALNKENFQLETLQLRDVKESSTSPKAWPRYQQKVNYLGNKIQLYSQKIPLSNLNYVGTFYHMGRAVFIPIHDELRQNLNAIEQFVEDNVVIPKDLEEFTSNENIYKPLYQGPEMYIPLSKFCKFYRSGRKVSFEDKQSLPDFGEGIYEFQIEVAHVYIGPHQNDKLVSLSLYVTGINFSNNESRPVLQRQNAVIEE